MVGQVVGYVRVSAADQNPDRQLEAIGKSDKVFTGKVSGKSRAHRQGLADLINCIRTDDTVRIAADKNGASPLDSLMLGIISAFAEFERRRIKERQVDGIALAKAKGKYVQAPKLSGDDVEQAQAMLNLGLPKTEVAARLGVSQQTLYSALKRN